MNHPLIGRVIRIDSDDRESHTISRFTADLGSGLMLAVRLLPDSGEALAISHIIVLKVVAQEGNTAIFDTWAAYHSLLQQRIAACEQDEADDDGEHLVH